MSLQLLNEINENYQMALAVHRETADCHWFGYQFGYAMLHEYQYLSESCTQRKIKRYITETYHAYIPDKLPKSANIAEPLIGNRKRTQLKLEDSRKMISELFRIYMEWEESALREYQGIAAELLKNGDVAAFNFVSDEIIKDVKAELVYVTDKNIELTSHNYDMPQIVGEQPDIFERYEYLIKKMFGKSKQFHHWNGALDPSSRVLFKKSPEE